MNMAYREQKIPQDISALAESYHLGMPIKVYRRLLHEIMMYGCIALLLGFILVAVLYVHTALGELAFLAHGDLKLKQELQRYFLTRQMPLEMTIIVLSALICVMHIFTFYLQQKQRLYIFSEGLLVSLGTVRNKYRAVRWVEVVDLSSKNVMHLTDGSLLRLPLPFSSSSKKESYQTISNHIASHCPTVL